LKTGQITQRSSAPVSESAARRGRSEERRRACVARRSIFPVAQKDYRMFDILFLAIGIGAFFFTALYLSACDSL
jgi:hypothetical protein